MSKSIDSHNNISFSILDFLKRDKLLLFLSLVFITAISWWYMFYLAGKMDHSSMQMDMMPQMMKWGIIQFLLTFIMWFVMMIAMMVPSVTPAVFIFSNVYQKRAQSEKPVVSSWIFLLGYLSIWLVFSFLATLFQSLLINTALLSPMMKSTSNILGGIILIGCGLFQWSSIKYSCLKHCRSPLDFLMGEWRDGKSGAFIMGFRHGYYCLGCCWLLMLLLFITGVMNLLWVALIALFVLIEKVAPWGIWISRFTGVILVVAGIWVIFS